jgi:hypothetical protein
MLVCDACQRRCYRLIEEKGFSYCVQCTTSSAPASSSECQAIIMLVDCSLEVGEIMCEALVVQQPVLN